jgi:hypothetical protein
MIGKKLLSWIGVGVLSLAAIPAGAAAIHHHTTKHASKTPTRHATASHHTAKRSSKATAKTPAHHTVSHKNLSSKSAGRKPTVSTVKHTSSPGVRSMHSGHANAATSKAPAARKSNPVVAVKHTSTPSKSANKTHTIAAATR